MLARFTIGEICLGVMLLALLAGFGLQGCQLKEARDAQERFADSALKQMQELAEQTAELKAQGQAAQTAYDEITAAAAARHQEALINAQNATAELRARIDAGDLRLRNEWAGYRAATAGGGSAAGAEGAAQADRDRTEGLGNLLRHLKEADAHYARCYTELEAQNALLQVCYQGDK